jgi:hypothetical protein
VRAVEAFEPANTPLEIAATRHLEDWRRLAGGSLIEAADYYVKHHPQGLPRKLVAEVVDELLAAKQADGAREVYRRDLRGAEDG